MLVYLHPERESRPRYMNTISTQHFHTTRPNPRSTCTHRRSLSAMHDVAVRTMSPFTVCNARCRCSLDVAIHCLQCTMSPFARCRHSLSLPAGARQGGKAARKWRGSSSFAGADVLDFQVQPVRDIPKEWPARGCFFGRC